MSDGAPTLAALEATIDGLEELELFASFAGRLLDTLDDEDDGLGGLLNWQAYRKEPHGGPEQFVARELRPFLTTLQMRLPEVHEQLKSVLDNCADARAAAASKRTAEGEADNLH